MPYEFVPRKEYRPFQEKVETIINKVQNLVREHFTFQFRIAGSAGRSLITREIGGNKGFDLDYNLILNNPNPKEPLNPELAKAILLKAFDEATKGTMFDHPENSTSAITIKVKDRAHSRILRSCDFCVVYYPNDKKYTYYKYVRFNKQTKKYTWEIRDISNDAEKKLKWLKIHADGAWLKIKEEYKNLKDVNKDPDKNSFQLYFEAINNVFNQYRNQQVKAPKRR